MKASPLRLNSAWFTHAKVAAYAAWDEHAAGLPARRDAIPPTASKLTTEWLTAVLCTEHPQAKVISFELGGGSDGTSSRRQLRVSYNAAGQAAGLPRALYTKTTPDVKTRTTLGPTGALANEVEFYRKLWPHLNIETPKAYFADYDPRSYRSMIVLEDVAVSKGAQFCDPSVYVTCEMAEDMVRLLAKLHAKWWGSAEIARMSWLHTRAEFQARASKALDWEDRVRVGLERAAGAVPAELAAQRDRFIPALRRSLELNVEPPITVLHADVHVGNWYRKADGRMGLCDWQVMVKGQWAADVSYTLASALSTENRRAWERGLIAAYLDQLAQAGVAAPHSDAAWDAYSLQPVRPFLTWLFTIGAATWQPDMQPREICLANLQRMAQQILDFDALNRLTR